MMKNLELEKRLNRPNELENLKNRNKWQSKKIEEGETPKGKEPKKKIVRFGIAKFCTMAGLGKNHKFVLEKMYAREEEKISWRVV